MTSGYDLGQVSARTTAREVRRRARRALRGVVGACALLLVAATWGCGGDDATPEGDTPGDTSNDADTATDVDAPCGGFEEPCCPGQVCGDELLCDAATSLCVIAGDPLFGRTCSVGEDCPTGVCVPIPGAATMRCSRTCEGHADCLAGWDCEDLDGHAEQVCQCTPSAERCNGLDDNCNGVVDDATAADAACADEGAANACVEGQCECVGVVPMVCDEACVDADSDDAHCGGCDAPCGPGQRCAETACVCREGYDDCDGDMDNGCEPLDDTVNCGRCDNACAPGFVCEEGECAPPAPPEGFVFIPAGEFTMGSPPEEEGRIGHENQVAVTLEFPFFLAATEVTQAQWKALASSVNPSWFAGCDACPVDLVTWHSALGYLNALSAAEGLTPCYTLPAEACTGSWQGGSLVCDESISVSGSESGSVYECDGYRLPTEAEWEYAARAGTVTATYAGDLTSIECDDETLPPIAWFCGNSGEKSHPVGTRAANPWGLYDMLGNAYEWNWDRYGTELPGGVNPEGAAFGSLRVIRGGSWGNLARSLRAADRIASGREYRELNVGFRVARSVR